MRIWKRHLVLKRKLQFFTFIFLNYFLVYFIVKIDFINKSLIYVRVKFALSNYFHNMHTDQKITIEWYCTQFNWHLGKAASSCPGIPLSKAILVTHLMIKFIFILNMESFVSRSFQTSHKFATTNKTPEIQSTEFETTKTTATIQRIRTFEIQT